MSTRLRLTATTALTCTAVLLPGAAAAAAEPEKAGWWNRASAGGLSLPQPTAQPGDLRVSAGPDGPLAYAAVLYRADGATAATLDLTLRAGSAVGAGQVVACPTQDTAWPEGDNQSFDKAPPFDCEVGRAFGVLSEDGATLTFALDSGLQTEPGVFSLALVPEPGTTSPFTLDLVKPGPESFTAELAETTNEDTSSGGSDVAPPSSGGGDQGGSGEAFLPGGFDAPAPADVGGDQGGSGEAFLPGGFDAPAPADVGGTGAVDAPLLAGDMSAVPGAAAAPAPSVASGAAPAAAPLIFARPAAIGEDLGAGRRLLALLVLAGGSAAVGYAAGQQRSGPRLIGGRSRAGVVPTAVAATPAVPSAQDRPRGIGRFAKDRTEAPRRLR